jgi:hypothetical protein
VVIVRERRKGREKGKGRKESKEGE